MSGVFTLALLDLSAAFDIINHFAAPALRIGMGGRSAMAVNVGGGGEVHLSRPLLSGCLRT